MRSTVFRTICAAWMLVLGVLHVRGGGVVINEIMYHAPGDLDALQYVEVLNSGSAEADLAGWRFNKGITYTFPTGTRLSPGRALVLASDAALFVNAYRFQPFGVFHGVLKKKGEAVELVDGSGKRVDRVRFASSEPWPRSPDGFSSSLERISPDVSGEIPANWESSRLAAGPGRPAGSPGRPNPVSSTNVPPWISQVEIRESAQAQRPGYTVRAQVEDADGLSGVRVLYRTVSTGELGAERALPMTLKGDGAARYEAFLPQPTQGMILRIRLEAVDRLGGLRLFPGENEPRPAFSFLLSTQHLDSSLPQMSFIHARTEELARARRVVAGNGFKAPPAAGGEEAGKQRFDRAFRSGLDLSYIWAHLAFDLRRTAEELTLMRPLFIDEAASRERRIAEALARVGNQGIEVVRADIKSERSRFVEGLMKVLPTDASAALRTWWERDGVGYGIGARSASAASVLRRTWDLERAFAQASLRPQLQGSQLGELRDVFVSHLERRNALRPMAESVLKEEDGQAQLAEKVRPLSLDAAAEVQRRFGIEIPVVADVSSSPGQGNASPVQGGSALIYFDPVAHRHQLFDFVEIVPRAAGWKVHFQKDRLLEGMSTVNVIFESNERFVLAEPMAFEFYRRVGMSAPRAGFVRLTVDGRPCGYQAWVEQPNKAFLRRNKIGDEGHLYKLLWYGQGLKGQHEKKTRVKEGHADLVALIDVLKRTENPDAQWQVIRQNFNVPEVVDYFAVNMCLSHWDGFFNNYFTYHDVGGTGKWTMYPWDQDKTWGFHDGIRGNDVFYDMPVTFGMNGDRVPGLLGLFLPSGNPGIGHTWWRPPGWFSGPLLSNPTFQKHYYSRVRQLLETEYTPEKWEPTFQQLEARLRGEVRYRAELLGEDPGAAEGRLKAHVDTLRQHLLKRRQFLLERTEIRSAPAFDARNL